MLQGAGVAFSETAASTSSTGVSESGMGTGIESESGEGMGMVKEQEEAAAARALLSQYRAAKQFEENAGLRRERARVIEQLKQFQVHLHAQRSKPAPVHQHKRAKQ